MQEVPVLVVGVRLEERGRRAVREAAEHLTVREQRVEERPGVVDGHVVGHAHRARLALDLDRADVDDEAVRTRRGDAVLGIGRVEVRRRARTRPR